MNRKIIVLFIIIGIFAIIGVSTYAYINGILDTASEVSSEVSEVSEVSSETGEASIETSEVTKDPSEGVDTEVPVDSEAVSDSQVEGDPEAEYDENGDLRSESKYLDDDGDTIANYFDICPGVDDFSSDCETDAYDSVADENTIEDTADTTSAEVDENGAVRSESTYLDDDGDTIANYFDICPGVDDFSSDCETDAYNK